MTRRTVLQGSALLMLLGLTNAPALVAAPAASNPKKARGAHTFRVGQIEVTILSDGHVWQHPMQPNFAPGTPAEAVNDVLTEQFAPTTGVDLALNILLLKFQQQLILVDTGCGANFGAEAGWLVDNLRAVGVKPADITAIVITHAHPDHIGGLTDGSGNLVFKRAAVHLSKVDHDFWMAAAPDFSKSRLLDPASQRGLVDIAQRNIRAAGARLHLFEDGEELLGCLQVQLAPGHTPGHALLRLHSAGEELYHIVDLVHAQALTFEYPEWGVNSDTDYELAISTRRKVLDQLAASRAWVFAYHLPWPGLGHVRRKNEGFEWIAQTLALPS